MVFISIYIRCVVYFYALDVLLNNNDYSSMLLLGKFIKEHKSLEGPGGIFFPKLLHGQYCSVYNVLDCSVFSWWKERYV